MLGIVQDTHIDIKGRQRRDEGRDRTVTYPLDRDLLAIVGQRYRDRVGTLHRGVRTNTEQ